VAQDIIAKKKKTLTTTRCAYTLRRKGSI